MKTVMLEPIHESQTVKTGSRLLDVLQQRKLNVLASCGGQGLCATCHVKVKRGMEHLSPRNEREKRTLSFITGTDATSRLACQCLVYSNGATIELPKGMYIEKAEDLLSLLGTRAPEDILHPIKGIVLIAKGKIITRTQIEELRSLNDEVQSATNNTKTAIPDSEFASSIPTRPVLPIHEVGPKGSTRIQSLSTRMESNIQQCASEGIQIRSVPVREPEIGMQLGKCKLMEKLGTGSSGTVFRALHQTLNISVAVKVLKLTTNSDGSFENTNELRQQLCDEARLLAQLNHPHIVRVWDYDEQHEFPYVVLELVEGLSLAELIEQSGRLKEKRVVAIGCQVADALATAWQLGVVHRDVKPGNILLSRDGRKVKLADLGLACTAKNVGRHSGPAGTVAYMAPEQGSGGEIDHRSDIYALGATLYHSVTGHLPFTGKSWREVLYKHTNSPLVRADQVVPGISASFSGIIDRMMSKDPEDRYQTYAELIQDLSYTTPEMNESKPLTERLKDKATSGELESTSGTRTSKNRWANLLGVFRR